MDLNDIYLKIRRAQLDESVSGSLASYISVRIPSLHPVIQLEQDPIDQLTRFVTAYIKQVPKLLLDAAQHCADYTSNHWLPLSLNTVCDIFRTSFKKGDGLCGLLGRAYLAHRVIEELNDRFIVHFGYTLVEPDLTRANLVAYQLLGENEANNLDRAVEMLTFQLRKKEGLSDLCDESDSGVRQVEAWAQRSCLSSDSGLKLNWKETEF